jgi:hypothetical protein
MKKLLIYAFASFLIVSCGNKAEVERLTQENEALTNELNRKDSTLNLFEESFSTIQENLALIGAREKEIALNAGDLKDGDPDAREEITRDIQAINNLLMENKTTIENLNKKVSAYGAETASFKKLISQLNADVASKEEQISYLKENLTAANFTIDILNEMLDSAEFRNEIQASMIQLQADELTTAFYAIGTYKELKDNGVLEKDGTVVGLGGSKQLKEDFNREYFQEISIVETTTIASNSKKMKLVTNHPVGTFEITGEDLKTLKIIQPLEFWSVSKYLVIVTD